MMRRLVITIASYLFFLGAQAQDINLRKVTIGAFVGLNISSYSMQSNNLEAGSRFGYKMGGFIRYGGCFYLQSGLTY